MVWLSFLNYILRFVKYHIVLKSKKTFAKIVVVWFGFDNFMHNSKKEKAYASLDLEKDESMSQSTW